jgi:hypothetical protein
MHREAADSAVIRSAEEASAEDKLDFSHFCVKIALKTDRGGPGRRRKCDHRGASFRTGVATPVPRLIVDRRAPGIDDGDTRCDGKSVPVFVPSSSLI